MLLLPEAREKRNYDISERRRRENEGEIRPAQSAQVTGKEAKQAQDSSDHPGVPERDKQQAAIVQGYGANLPHAMRQQRVSYRCRQHDEQQDEITLRGEGMFHVFAHDSRKKRSASLC